MAEPKQVPEWVISIGVVLVTVPGSIIAIVKFLLAPVKERLAKLETDIGERRGVEARLFEKLEDTNKDVGSLHSEITGLRTQANSTGKRLDEISQDIKSLALEVRTALARLQYRDRGD